MGGIVTTTATLASMLAWSSKIGVHYVSIYNKSLALCEQFLRRNTDSVPGI